MLGDQPGFAVIFRAMTESLQGNCWGARVVSARIALGSGADVLALQAAGLAVGGTLSVVGFLQFAMRLGHGVSPRAGWA